MNRASKKGRSHGGRSSAAAIDIDATTRRGSANKYVFARPPRPLSTPTRPNSTRWSVADAGGPHRTHTTILSQAQFVHGHDDGRELWGRGGMVNSDNEFYVDRPTLYFTGRPPFGRDVGRAASLGCLATLCWSVRSGFGTSSFSPTDSRLLSTVLIVPWINPAWPQKHW